MTTKLDAPFTLFTIRGTGRSPGSDEANGSGTQCSILKPRQTGDIEQLDTVTSTAGIGTEDQGSCKRNPRESNARWSQNPTFSTPKINVIQMRHLTTNSRIRLKRESGRAIGGNFDSQWIKDYFRRTDERLLPQLRNNSADANECRASPHQATAIEHTSYEPRKGKVLIGNFVKDQPYRGRPLVRGHLREEPLVRKKWAIAEGNQTSEVVSTAMSTSQVEERLSHLPEGIQVRILRSRIRQGSVRGHAKEVDVNQVIEQGPEIRKDTLLEPLVRRTCAIEEKMSVPEAPFCVRTHEVIDEKDSYSDVIGQASKDRISHVQLGDTEPQKKQCLDKLLVKRMKQREKIEKRIAKKAAKAGKREVHEAKSEGAKPMTLKAKWKAEINKASGKLKFIPQGPQKKLSNYTYREVRSEMLKQQTEIVAIRRHLSIEKTPKSRLDQAVDNDQASNRLDETQIDGPTTVNETKKTRRNKAKSEVQAIFELNTREGSNARGERKSSTSKTPEGESPIRRLYQTARTRPEALPTTPTRDTLVKYQPSDSPPQHNFRITRHLTDRATPPSVRPTPSRDHAQSLHSQYHLPFSHDDPPGESRRPS